MVDNATAAGERYGRGWHPTTAAGVAPQVGEAFDRLLRLHHLVGAVLFLGGGLGERHPPRFPCGSVPARSAEPKVPLGMPRNGTPPRQSAGVDSPR